MRSCLTAACTFLLLAAFVSPVVANPRPALGYAVAPVVVPAPVLPPVAPARLAIDAPADAVLMFKILVLRELAVSRHLTGQRDESSEHFAAALALCADEHRSLRAILLSNLANLQMEQGRMAEAQAKDWSFLDAVLAGVFTVPGDGGVDFGAFAKLLADIGYSGWAVVEAEQDPAKAPPFQYAKMGHDHLSRVFADADITIVQ